MGNPDSTESVEQLEMNMQQMHIKEERYRRMYESQLEAELVDTRLLQRISAQLIEQENIEELYKTIVNAALRIMRSDFASLQMFYPEKGGSGRLKLIASRGLNADAVMHWKWVDCGSKNICSLAIERKNRVICPDIRKSEFLSGTKELEMKLKAGIVAIQSTPLVSRNGEMVGMLSTHWRQPHKPSERDLRLVDILVRQAADLVENKKTQRALHNSEMKLRVMNETLEQRVEERTASLVSYQNQLRSLAYQLAKTEEHERKRLAAFLHDNLGQVLAVGKMKLDLINNSDFPEHLTDSMNKLAGLMNDAIGYTRELMSDLNPFPSVTKTGLMANVDWVAKKMKTYGLDVTVTDDGLPKQLSEEMLTAINQSVKELLFNVVKHAGVDKAAVSLSRLDDTVEIVLKDNGKGFNYSEKLEKPTGRGGFGLFNLQERMHWLGGSMEVSSKPGEGTEVSLILPVQERENEPSVDGEEVNGRIVAEPGRQTGDTKIKVLIADDHQMMRKGLCKLISEQNDLIVVAEASSGKDVVELAQAKSPDVIIMDINMPGVDGIEATRRISRMALPVRIIGLSFHEDEDVKRSIIDAGASVYLSKSEVFETLCATVRSEGMMLRGWS